MYIPIPPKLVVRRSLAADMLDSMALLEALEKAEWIKPVWESDRIALYSVDQLKDAVNRLANGEKP